MPNDPHPHDAVDGHDGNHDHDAVDDHDGDHDHDGDDGREPTARVRSDPEPATGAAFECSYCDRAFAKQEWRALHHGVEHLDRLDDGERAAYEAAHEAETEELRLFRLKALAALVLLYFLFVMAYAVFA